MAKIEKFTFFLHTLYVCRSYRGVGNFLVKVELGFRQRVVQWLGGEIFFGTVSWYYAGKCSSKFKNVITLKISNIQM